MARSPSQSAADADLDAARSLVLAGRRFNAPELTEDGKRLGVAILKNETVAVGTGAAPPSDVNPQGTWVAGSGASWSAETGPTTPPYVVNPGYFSPRAEGELFEASADRRWADITRTQRVLGWQLIGTGMLPPDWATVTEAGHAIPTGPVTGECPYASVSTPRAYQSGSPNPAIERTEPSRVRCARSSLRRVKFPRCATWMGRLPAIGNIRRLRRRGHRTGRRQS